MQNVTLDDLKKASGLSQEYEPILQALLGDGLSSRAFDLRVAALLGLPYDDPRVAITRMNIVGGLRAQGYLVSGGRSGGFAYQVEGWEQKEYKVTADQWQGKSKEVLDQVQALRSLSLEDFPSVRSSLSLRDQEELLHENCFLYPWAYEGARAHGFNYIKLKPSFFHAIIFRRFYNYPQLRIFLLAGTFETALGLAEEIAPASMKRVQIINVSPEDAQGGKAFRDVGEWWGREEGIYDLKDIAEHPDKYLHKRALQMLKAREKDTQFELVEPPDFDHMEKFDPSLYEAHALSIIDTWQRFNESKHRQLAITRDRIAVRSHISDALHFLGYREGSPVIHHLLEPMANNSGAVSLINEKSLNYREMGQGGCPGLSDFNQIQTARILSSMGYQFEQSGGLDGGGIGLEAKKRKYACQIVKSWTFVTNFPVSEYA